MADIIEIRFLYAHEKWNANEVASFQPHIAMRYLEKKVGRYDNHNNMIFDKLAVPVRWDEEAGGYVEYTIAGKETRVTVTDEDSGEETELELVIREELDADPDGVVQKAIIELLDDENAWTTDGRPSTDALGEKLGFKISAAVRDEIWDAMQLDDGASDEEG